MKVVCIDNNGVNRLLTEGAKYTVEFETDSYYHLTEILINPITGREAGFYKSRFVPLSSIDEKEMERNYDLNKVTA